MNLVLRSRQIAFWTSLIQKEDSPLSGLGCFLSPEEYASTLYCFVEQSASAGYSPERVAEKVKDALYRQWEQYDPNMVNTFLEWNFNYARSNTMASMLQSVDLVSSLSGRATTTAMFTHFTGDASYFSTNMNRLNNITPSSTREVAQKYITRERAVAVIVEPMNEEEKERREASAQKESRSEKVQEYHATTDKDRYTSVYDAKQVDVELIKEQVVSPDLENINQFTLDNGLNVSILPYGEAPLVRVALKVKGDVRTEEIPGLDLIAERAWYSGDKSRESLLSVAGFMSGSNQSVSVSLPSGNLEEGLNKIRWAIEPSNMEWSSRYDLKKRSKSWAKSTKRSSKEPDTWASRMMYEALFPEHVLGDWMQPEEYLDLYKLPKEDLQEWVYSKWQPANSELFVVGKIDSQEAEELVRRYFANWQYNGTKAVAEMGFLSQPEQLPNQAIFVYDKPIATQSQISLMCRMDTSDKFKDGPRATVVGNVLSEEVWRRLREEAGVTYGAYAYDALYSGGIGALGMQSLVQNNAVGFAVESMYEIVDAGSKGEVRPQSIADAQMSLAREFALRQQSGSQMLSRLMSIGTQNFDYFDQYALRLSAVSSSDFEELLAPCVGKEVMTIVGPKEQIVPQLEEIGVKYEVVDWMAKYESLLSPKELKKYQKNKEKEENQETAKN